MKTTQFPLDFQWQTQEPFLFCVHHNDHYPIGNSQFAPEAHHFQGRDIGQDFQEKDGFRMYHGDSVPGFPVHPHRGFETITIVRRGYVDHADSMGAAGRYGQGDVQWMTAGQGVQHSEMFPLLNQDKENPVELFQIWLNLPKKNKMVPAAFKMFWSEKIPAISADNGKVQINLIAGKYNQVSALQPPPHSWASDEQNEVFIALVKMQPEASFEIPKAENESRRAIYFFDGSEITLNGQAITQKTGVFRDGQEVLQIQSKKSAVEFLILQARPINEPVVQHGPFVMNSQDDIVRTIHDYQRTQFGGWSWPRQDMVHGPVIERFARYPDGKTEKPV